MKVLYIGFKKQNGILEGGGIANLRCLRMLKKRFGAENVTAHYIMDEAEHRPLWSYAYAVPLFLFNYHNGLTPHEVRHIIGLARSYDIVFLSTSVIAVIAKKLRESGYQGEIVTHYHNVESIYYDAIMPKWLPGRGVVVNCAAHNDRYGCLYSDKIITLSSRDSRYLEKYYGRKADAVIDVSLEDTFRPPVVQQLTGRRPKCLFLGSYSKPNNDGVLFFVKNVLPHVDIDFKIVGKGMSRLKQENKCLENIEVVSDVPDLRPYFEEADFMILPVFAGSGMKIKTCESLMYGKNILASGESLEGYHLDAERIGGLCNTAEDYINRLKHFIEHPVPRFNAYSREVYLKNHSETATYNKFADIFSNPAPIAH